jgi:4-hydroxybenzoate polyprenyltransferase
MAWLRLIRWKNLIIVFFTQLLAWLCVIVPSQKYLSHSLLLNAGNFFLLALSTVLIAAAGYIINDYFDLKIDIINRPEKTVLEKRIPMKMAILMHSILNLSGLFLAVVVIRNGGSYKWLIIQLFCTLLLWFYSTHFKRQYITGNVVVSLLTALTIVTLVIYEPSLHPLADEHYFVATAKGQTPNPVWVLGMYAYFAFMLTWMREIVKDMEDLKGDAEQGCMTLPIKAGLRYAARFTIVIGAVAVIPLLAAGVKLLLAGWFLLGGYTILALVLPLIVWMAGLDRHATPDHYARYSRYLKIIMILGIVSLVVYYLETHA